MIFNERYEILRQLAKRSRRMTLLARDLTTQEWVVLKLVFFNSELELNELRLFEREIRTLHYISHPAVPNYLDCFELSVQNNKALALVQTYIPGKSLQKYLQAGRIFTEAEAKEIARKLLEVLKCLHQMSPPIIHRDLKPDNILLVEDPSEPLGHIYLIDFGAVSISANPVSSGDSTAIGTYGYMPPEQFGGRAVPASDLYGLGMTLIALVTGTHPSKLPRKNLRVQFEEVVTLSPAFTDWLKWLTESGLEHRLTSAQEALEALNREEPRCFKPSLVFRRPIGSRIALHKTASSLEVFIPAATTGRMVKVCGMIAMTLILGATVGTLWALRMPTILNVLTTILLCLPLWGVSIGLLLCVLFTMFGRVRLRVNQQQIALLYEIFHWKFNDRKSAPTKTVSKIKYVKPSGGNEAKVHPRIILFAKTQRYELGSNILFNLVNRLGLTNDPKGFGTLTEAELDWLANELSHWLGLSIDQI